jgi:hypothetical protein
MEIHNPSILDFEILVHALEITAIVFSMMIFIEWIDVRTRGKIPQWINKHKAYQYLIPNFLGLTPGCMGAYLNVSLYMHGYLTLGALLGGMIATTGEASLVMFALIPSTAVKIHLMLFFIAIPSAILTDYLVGLLKISYERECEAIEYHQDEQSILHYLKAHIWQHIIKKHIWRIFLWTLFAIWLVHLGMKFFDLSDFTRENPQLMLLIAILIGLIPDIAPQFIFVFLFAEGIIPFSVLLTSSIVQNGHALLPLLSYSIRDTITIKSFNVLVGLIMGWTLMALGF